MWRREEEERFCVGCGFSVEGFLLFLVLFWVPASVEAFADGAYPIFIVLSSSWHAWVSGRCLFNNVSLL